MARCQSIWVLVSAAALLAACDQKQPPAATAQAPAASAATTAAPSSAAPTPLTPATATIPPPDVGKLSVEKVTADGYGPSASDAVAEALRLAILQVNGASIDMVTVNTKLGVDVTLNQTSASMRAEGFREAVRQRSGGVVQNFRIVAMDEPLLPKGKYKATIEAGIAKFEVPAELKKIKLAVAPLRFDKAMIPMGDRSVPAAEVGAELRQRIVDALVNTGRFAVLDREFSPEIQQELGHDRQRRGAEDGGRQARPGRHRRRAQDRQDQRAGLQPPRAPAANLRPRTGQLLGWLVGVAETGERRDPAGRHRPRR